MKWFLLLSEHWEIIAGGGGAMLGWFWRKVLLRVWRRTRNLIRELREMNDVRQTLTEVERKLNLLVQAVQPNGGSSMFDVIARIEANQKRQTSLQRAFQDVSFTAWWESNADGECVYASPALMDLVGGSPLGNDWISFLVPEDRERIRREWSQAVQDQRRFNDDYSFQHLDGRRVRVKATAVPVFIDSDSPCLGYIGVVTSITNL